MQAQRETVNLFSIGPQKAGKTVFIAGSYTELSLRGDAVGGGGEIGAHPTYGLRLELDDEEPASATLAKMLDAVVRTGQYPPTPAETQEFLFRLEASVPITRNYLRWWDVPGKDCCLTHPNFQALVLRSHGCCIFMNAEALLHQPGYVKDEDLQQLQAIALVARHSDCYPMAVILTQMDRIDPADLRALEPKLQPLYERLTAAKVTYKTFFSAIPIIENDTFALQPSTAGALIWLLSELNHSDYRELGARLRQSLAAGNKLWETDQYMPAVVQGYLTILATTNISLQALPALEKLVVEEPENLQLQLDLARCYEHRGQPQQAESVYNRILAQQEHNVKALLGKALLRQAQGDVRTASHLLAQAQQVAATSDLKAKISALASRVSSRQL